MKPPTDRSGTVKESALREVEAAELVALTGGYTEVEARIHQIIPIRAKASILSVGRPAGATPVIASEYGGHADGTASHAGHPTLPGAADPQIR
jgi:hypothetical protein